jgi:hypothetical protein
LIAGAGVVEICEGSRRGFRWPEQLSAAHRWVRHYV